MTVEAAGQLLPAIGRPVAGEPLPELGIDPNPLPLPIARPVVAGDPAPDALPRPPAPSLGLEPEVSMGTEPRVLVELGAAPVANPPLPPAAPVVSGQMTWVNVVVSVIVDVTTEVVREVE